MKIIVSEIVLLVSALLSLGGCGDSNMSEAKVRITIVAKDQAFHLEDQPELRNPPITLSIDSGQTVSVKVRPVERGTLTYACLMHPPMAGKIIVQ